MTNPFDKLAGLRDQLPPGPEKKQEAAKPKEKKLFAQKVVVRKERKGHGGKTVTVVDGVLPGVRDEIADELKRALGCGARIEGDSILLQGELVDRAIAWLEKKGAKNLVKGS